MNHDRTAHHYDLIYWPGSASIPAYICIIPIRKSFGLEWGACTHPYVRGNFSFFMSGFYLQRAQHSANILNADPRK